MRSPLILRVFKDSQLFVVKQFDQEQVVIGHNADVHLDLDGDGVAGIHCLIEKRDQGYYICDLGSQSGTFKNGQAVLDEVISSGDDIQVGPFKISFFVGVPKPKASPQADVQVASAPPKAAPVASVSANSARQDADLNNKLTSATSVQASIPVVEYKEEPVVKASIPATTTVAGIEKYVPKPEIKAQPKTVAAGKKKKNRKTFAPASEIKDLRSYLKPSKGNLVEVVVAWRERILTTYHFSQKGAVKIVDSSDKVDANSIYLPAGFAPKNWTILDLGSVVKINSSNEMKIELVQPNEVLNLDALFKAGRSQRTNIGISSRLDQGEMICLSSANSEIQIFIRFINKVVAAPLLAPMLLSASEITGVVMSVVMVSILALYISATTPKDNEDQKQEDVQHVAQVIFNVPPKPPTPPPPPPPEPKQQPPPPQESKTPPPPPKEKKVVVADVNKEAQKKGNASQQPAEKAQTAAKAAEVAPKPNSTNRPKKFTSTKQGGAVKQGETAGANAQSANKDVSKIGLFSALSSGGNREKLDKAYSGSGEVLGMADKATGTSGFNENRAGDDLGSKFKDTGAGGKGTATQGIAGIGTKGRSSGQSAYGASDGFGNKSSVAIEPGGAEEEFAGTIDKEAIRRVIKARLQEVRSCYERVLNKNPKGVKLEGKVILSWNILEKGVASNVHVVSSSLNNAEIEKCICTRLASWVFPEPPPDMKAEIKAYPFVLNQAN